MSHSLSHTLQRQQFHPGVLGIFINPFYFTRRELRKYISFVAPQIRGKTLDIGCGSKPYKELFTDASEYIGMDFDSPEKRLKIQADIFYDGNHFPFSDQSFDSAVATEVLEHIFNPDQFISEIHRILKTGGTLILTTPFIWDEHEQPFDYARYSSFGIRHLLDAHGFTILEHHKTATDLRALFQLLNCYIYKILPFNNYRIRLLFFITLCGPITILGLLASAILPRNKDLYLSNVILAKKI